jgi:peptidoglycan pentaglycine glycine transferase (the first glycine)
MVETVPVAEADRQRWNDFVAEAPSFSLMQSYEWGEFKERLGWQAIRVAVERRGQIVAGAQMLIRSLPFHFASIAYVPRGPLVDWEDRAIATALLDALHGKARRHRAIFLKVEPPLLHHPETHKMLQSYGFLASPHTNQPRCTMILDLDKELDEVLKDLRKRTRYGIRYAERQGVVVREGGSQDVEVFYHLMQNTGNRKSFPIRSLDYYRKVWQTFSERGGTLQLAVYQDDPLSGAMAFAFGDKAAYLYGASSDLYRDLMPSYVLQWELIKWARSQGCRTYDLWGIPDQVGQYAYEGKEPPDAQRTDGLWGVYRFKRGFGQNIVYYVGAYDYVYSTLLYRIVEFATSRLGSVDKLAQLSDRFV